jgi:ketosteroid isomerase-like protein
MNLFKWNMAINCEEIKETTDWGYATGTYTFEMTPKKGGAPIKGFGKFLTILEKQKDGSWKISRDIFNYNAPLQ